MSAGFLSPCHGAPVHLNLSGSGPAMTGYYVCEACGQPCDPMPAEVRDRIVAEGMERAADIAHYHAADYEMDWSSPEFNYAKDVEDAIRREADRLAPKRRDIPTSPDTVDATPPSGAKLTPERVANRRHMDASADREDATDGRESA